MPQGKIQYSYYCIIIVLLPIIHFKLGIYKTWLIMYRLDTSVLNNGQLIRENVFYNYIRGFTNNNIIIYLIIILSSQLYDI